ncbi:MAG TPA: N-acetyl sugar amidotransferase [Saprospiraceae bacterium]|nr:N-acetyl sugar amidotransferase [Saprospiraceae bacterium]
MREYQICTNCVMDTSDSKIVFDEKGVCDHCNTYYKDIEPVWNYGKGREKELSSMADKIKASGKSKDFDCILGMSGGIDSSYLLYLAKEKLGLRPLVFHVDAGWNTQLAVNNIERLVDKLNLDLFTEVINWEEMKDLQLAYFKSGVPHIDVPQDHAFFATMYHFASKYKVNYILTGGNYSTECVRNPIEWMYYQSDSVQLKDIHKKFGQIPLADYLVTNILWHKVYLPYVKKIKVLRPLDYMQYNKQEAMDLLQNEFGWQPYPQKHFESRFTRFYESYWLPERFGYDTRRVQFSSLILTGQMSREDALNQLKLPAYDSEEIKHEFEFVANKLGISKEELQTYFNMPKKTHLDYKSQENIYKLGSKLMRLMGLERGGKR